MIPDPAAALQGIMGTLMMDIAPNMRDEYRQSSVSLLAFAAMVIATDLDRAAQVRVAENREMRAIFDAAEVSVDDATLKERLRTAAQGRDDDLLVSALTATNNELRRLLIELHITLEKQVSPQAERLIRQIWRFLRDAAERRAIQIG